MRRTLVAGVLVAVVAVAGCSKSEPPPASSTTTEPTTTAAPATTASPGTTRTPGTTTPSRPSGTVPAAEAAEYCTIVRDNEKTLQSGFDDAGNFEQFATTLADMEAAAPASQQANIAVLSQFVEGLRGLSPSEAESRLFQLFADEKLTAAANAVADFTEQQCGVSLSSSSSSGSSGGARTGDLGSSGDGGSPTPTLDDLKAAMQATAGSEQWYPALTGFGIGRAGDEVDITLSGDRTDKPLDQGLALSACQAASAWASSRYDAVSITVSGPDNVVLVRKPVGASSCERA